MWTDFNTDHHQTSTKPHKTYLSSGVSLCAMTVAIAGLEADGEKTVSCQQPVTQNTVMDEHSSMVGYTKPTHRAEGGPRLVPTMAQVRDNGRQLDSVSHCLHAHCTHHNSENVIFNKWIKLCAESDCYNWKIISHYLDKQNLLSWTTILWLSFYLSILFEWFTDYYYVYSACKLILKQITRIYENYYIF